MTPCQHDTSARRHDNVSVTARQQICRVAAKLNPELRNLHQTLLASLLLVAMPGAPGSSEVPELPLEPPVPWKALQNQLWNLLRNLLQQKTPKVLGKNGRRYKPLASFRQTKGEHKKLLAYSSRSSQAQVHKVQLRCSSGTQAQPSVIPPWRRTFQVRLENGQCTWGLQHLFLFHL